MSLDMDKDLWEQVLMICKNIQQEYYELLPDWNKYQEEDFNLLRRYIGCALGDFNDKNHGREMVSLIYDQIMYYGKESDGSIFCGVIYNIIHEIPKKDETINDKNIMCVPIFKIRNHSKASSYDDSVVTYNIQYIDNNGRLYVDWNDYLTCNKLFECIMVVPKNGYYEADDKFPITEESSKVLVAVHSSPACSKSTEIMNYVDKTFACLNIGALGITVLSLLTPLGPVVLLAGSAATISSGIWMFGRSVQNLIDRTLHGESVSPTNRQALPSWIGVAGTMMGVAMNQGSGVLARAARAGENVGLATRVAYNTMVIGNVTVNLVGIGFNGYCIAEKYREGRKVEMIDILSFITHAALFGNTVLNMQFAHDIIDSSHGKILQEYEATLRSKRHRKAYNKVKRNAESKAEIVRYVRKVQSRAELLSSESGSQTSGNKPSGAQLSDTQQKDSQPSGARSSGTQRNDGQASDSQPSGAQASGDQKSDSLPNGNKQKINKPSSNKSSGSQPSGSLRNGGNKPSGARSSGDQEIGSQPRGNKPSAARSSGTQRNDGQASDSQPSGAQASGDQKSDSLPNGNKQKINKPSSNKSSGSQPSGSLRNGGNKPSGARSSGDQEIGSQPRGNKPSGARSSGTQRNDGQASDSQPSGAQASGDQKSGSQPSGNKPSGARSSGTQRNDGQASDSQASVAQSSGDQKSDSLPNGNKQKINKPSSNKSSGSQPSGSQRNGNKPSGARSSGGQPNDSQSNGNKPSDSQASDNKSNGNKPKINEPSSNKSSDSRSNGSKTNDENKSVNKINNKNKSSVKTNDKKLSVCKTNDRKESVDKTNDEIKSGSGINRDIINKITKILFAGGKIYIANSIILDPIEFINNLNEPYGLSEFSHSFSCSINVSVIPLSGRFLKLLADYYGYHPLVSSLKAIPEFHMLLSEMQSIDNAEELLLKVSVLAMRMFTRYLKSCDVSIRNETDLFKIAYILWRYGMAHANGQLKEQDYEEIRSTIISVFDIISDNFETLIPTFLSALNIYWNNFVRSNVLIEN